MIMVDATTVADYDFRNLLLKRKALLGAGWEPAGKIELDQVSGKMTQAMVLYAPYDEAVIEGPEGLTFEVEPPIVKPK